MINLRSHIQTAYCLKLLGHFLYWKASPMSCLFVKEVQEKSYKIEGEELRQRVLGSYERGVRTTSGPRIVLLHHRLSSKFTSLCCVDPWSFFNKKIGFFSHNNIKYCWENHCRMFTKPRYFKFFIHTWDSVIFAAKLNLAIANGVKT